MIKTLAKKVYRMIFQSSSYNEDKLIKRLKRGGNRE